jgi:photosystem II stability/assembly factor-like uncharacterized protein
LSEGLGDESNGAGFTDDEVRIAAALVAYIETPSPAAGAELLAAAPGGFGEWLRDVGDAYPGREGSAWASATPSMIRDAQEDWCSEWWPKSTPDDLVVPMEPGIEGPTAEREPVGRRADRNGSGHSSFGRERHLSPRSRWRLGRGEPRWTARLAVAASVAAAVFVLVAALGVFPGGTPPPAVTQLSVTPVAWRITSFIDQPAWESSGPAGTGKTATNVVCPSSSTCYAAKEGVGPAPAVVEVSVDGGLGWQPSTLPAGWQLTSALACPSPAECLAGASASSAAGIVVTTDGGATWSVQPLPASVGQVTDLACGSMGQCVAAGYGPTSDPGSFGTPIVVPLSVAGGVSGAVVDLPPPFVAASPGGLACAAGGGLCVLVGAGLATRSSGPAAGTGVVFRSTDGGRTWSRADLPTTVAKVVAVSCPSSTRCIGVGNATSSMPGFAPYGPSEALVSGDGGQTWSLAGPYDLPAARLGSLSCPAPTRCWAAGSTPDGLGVIVATNTGGQSWTTVQLPTALSPAQQRSTGFTHLNIDSVSSVSCPNVSTCVAMAVPTSLASGDQQMVLRGDGL